MSLLSVQQVCKKFGDFTALDHVSIEVPEHSIFGLLGPNGAGKTTLIRIINQITAPDEGTVYLGGEKLKLEHTAHIGYLPEERGLYKKMTVGEQALYLAQLKGMTRHDAARQLKYWFEKFEIQAWWNKKIEELSKGMQQKIQFVVTIIHEPRLLIFDEPFSGFDPINANLLKTEILELKKKGATIIFSTHNMASVEELCDYIALINQSKKILDGKVHDIRRSHLSHTYSIMYKGFRGNIQTVLNPEFQLLETSRDENYSYATIRLPETAVVNDLLSNLMPHVELSSFQELIPSMNDIFIQAVGGSSDTAQTFTSKANDLLS